jgi:hypothetical protein
LELTWAIRHIVEDGVGRFLFIISGESAAHGLE